MQFVIFCVVIHTPRYMSCILLCGVFRESVITAIVDGVMGCHEFLFDFFGVLFTTKSRHAPSKPNKYRNKRYSITRWARVHYGLNFIRQGPEILYPKGLTYPTLAVYAHVRRRKL